MCIPQQHSQRGDVIFQGQFNSRIQPRGLEVPVTGGVVIEHRIETGGDEALSQTGKAGIASTR